MAQGAICRTDCSKSRVKSKPCRHDPTTAGPNVSSALAVHGMAAVEETTLRFAARREHMYMYTCIHVCHPAMFCTRHRHVVVRILRLC